MTDFGDTGPESPALLTSEELFQFDPDLRLVGSLENKIGAARGAYLSSALFNHGNPIPTAAQSLNEPIFAASHIRLQSTQLGSPSTGDVEFDECFALGSPSWVCQTHSSMQSFSIALTCKYSLTCLLIPVLRRTCTAPLHRGA